MTRTPAARRPAFTLIELLVIIFLITVIAAVALGVFGRVRGNVEKNATDATLTKINVKIDQRVKAINVQVTEDVKSNHPGYATLLGVVQNQDLAKAIWTHARMKNELPMTFNEARVPTPVFAGVTLPVKSMFAPARIPAGAAGGTPEESAALLYLAVTENAGGGTAADTDGLQQQTGSAAGTNLKFFKDGWGTPIAFVRTAYNAEVANPPFIRVGQPFDPFDPRFKLTAFATANPSWWTATRAPVTWVSGVTAAYPGAVNHVPTAISAGPNKKWGADAYGLPPIPDTDDSKDNQVSYRLRREGGRGE